jgi:hypothetical protein
MDHIHKLKYIYMGISDTVPAEIARLFQLHTIAKTYHCTPMVARTFKPKYVAFMNVATMAKNEAQDDPHLTNASSMELI